MALSYDDLVQNFAIESGQFILDDIETTTMLNKERIEMLIIRELAYYNKFAPLVKTQLLELYDRKIFDGNAASSGTSDIPILISEIRNKMGITQLLSFNRFGMISNQYWTYDANTKMFKTAMPKDVYEVTYACNHVYDKETSSIPTLDLTDSDLIKLVVGRMMISIGRSRRSFVLNDLPFTQDGEQLVAEGQDIYSAAVDSIQTSSRHMLAAF